MKTRYTAKACDRIKWFVSVQPEGSASDQDLDGMDSFIDGAGI